MKKLLAKIKRFCMSIWLELKDIKTLIILFIVSVIMYIPSILGGVIYLVTGSKLALGIAVVYVAFWAGPFTPFIPIAIFITLTIKRYLVRKNQKECDEIEESIQKEKEKISKDLHKIADKSKKDD